MSKVTKKLYITIDEFGTASWLTREAARQNHNKNGVLLEVPLTAYQQNKIQSISDALSF